MQALKHSRLIAPDANLADLRFSRCGRTDSGVSARGQVRFSKLSTEFCNLSTQLSCAFALKNSSACEF